MEEFPWSELDRWVEEQKALVIQPQIRFLWQVASELESFRDQAALRFGVPFAWGYDGLCFRQIRTHPPGYWRLNVSAQACRLDFVTPDDLRAGVQFWLSQVREAPDGRLVLVCGAWTGDDEKNE